ncbi:hypothetical protein [Deinococcus sp.]|uniref:hypothetical protein n=1 Tax=Deinococcus sp. TaxID=47478 RepID=UPI003CC5529B
MARQPRQYVQLHLSSFEVGEVRAAFLNTLSSLYPASVSHLLEAQRLLAGVFEDFSPATGDLLLDALESGDRKRGFWQLKPSLVADSDKDHVIALERLAHQWLVVLNITPDAECAQWMLYAFVQRADTFQDTCDVPYFDKFMCWHHPGHINWKWITPTHGSLGEELQRATGIDSNGLPIPPRLSRYFEEDEEYFNEQCKKIIADYKADMNQARQENSSYTSYLAPRELEQRLRWLAWRMVESCSYDVIVTKEETYQNNFEVPQRSAVQEALTKEGNVARLLSVRLNRAD